MGSDWSVAEFSQGLGDEHSPPPLSCTGLPLVTRSGHVRWVQTAGPAAGARLWRYRIVGSSTISGGSEGFTC